MINSSCVYFLKCASCVAQHLPLVSASLQLVQLSLLFLICPLKLRQANAVLHFNGVQHVHRHFTIQLHRDTVTRSNTGDYSITKFHKLAIWVRQFSSSYWFLLPLPPAVFLVGVQCSGQINVGLFLYGLKQNLSACFKKTV